jgi:hypothetical protein
MARQSRQTEDLITDLIYLRKEAGFVPDRVRNASAFLSVIGGDEVIEVVKARFISAIQSLPYTQNVEALMVAYGLLPEYEHVVTLRSRRTDYGKTIGRKYDTFVDRENAIIKELAIRLLCAYYPDSPIPDQLSLPHGGFLMPFISVSTIIEDRQFVRHHQTKDVVSLVDGAKGFEYISSAKTVIMPEGGLRVKSRYVKNGSIHVFVFPTPLNRGDSYEFSFDETCEDDNTADIDEDFAGQSFETPTFTYKQEVIFKGKKPKIIWGYRNLSRVERPSNPNDMNTLKLDANGSVQKDFTQLYNGLHSGIAWRW